MISPLFSHLFCRSSVLKRVYSMSSARILILMIDSGGRKGKWMPKHFKSCKTAQASVTLVFNEIIWTLALILLLHTQVPCPHPNLMCSTIFYPLLFCFLSTSPSSVRHGVCQENVTMWNCATPIFLECELRGELGGLAGSAKTTFFPPLSPVTSTERYLWKISSMPKRNESL